MKKVKLTHGKFALVDNKDFIKFVNLKWYLDSTGYASKRINKKTIRLHQFLIGKKQGKIIDHINRNKLDNRRKNLRFVTHQQNQRNRSVKGICWDKSRNKWLASIKLNYKDIYLGRFKYKKDALKARKLGEKKYWK